VLIWTTDSAMERSKNISHPDKTVGVMGGMGPASTADFFLRLIRATPATKDQDHLRIIVDSNPRVPDRTLALCGCGESPLDQLTEMVHNLERAGAEIIAIPCNTAHHYYKELQDSASVPVINMVSETMTYVYRDFPDVRKLGLLATTGTIKTGIYHKALQAGELMVPDEHAQQRVMKAIYGRQGIKAGCTRGSSRTNILRVTEGLVKRGAEAIIIGCTEISLVLRQEDVAVPLVDPLQILAEVVVNQAWRLR